MQRDLSFFMSGSATDITEEEVIVSRRYLDQEGKPVPFILKPLPTDRVEKLEEECTVPVFEGKSKKKVGEKLDSNRFQARLAIETTVYPNFRDKAMLESYGLADPVEVAKKVLNIAGEYAEWMREVNRVNGLDDSFEDLVEEAKNS